MEFTVLENTGLITFSNLLFLISTLLIIIGASWLFGLHILKIIAHIPLKVIEISLYTLFSVSIYHTPYFNTYVHHVWGLLFALGLSCTTFITITRCKFTHNKFMFLNMLIHGIVGIYLKSQLISAVAVLFFCFLIDTNIRTFHNELNKFPSSTTSEAKYAVLVTEGFMAFLGAYSRINNFTSELLFSSGLFWIGTSVFFFRIIMTSISPRTSRDFFRGSTRNINTFKFNFTNLLTTLIFCMFIFFGYVHGIDSLVVLAGGFFSVYLISKYVEYTQYNIISGFILILGMYTFAINMYFRTKLEHNTKN